MHRKRFAALPCAAAAAALALSGCATKDADDVIGLRPSPESITGAFTTSVDAGRAPGVGAVVTDSAGWVLYRSDADEKGTSRCYDACARTWPPVLTDGSPALDGVAPERIGNRLRSDGQRQLTVDGWPVHRYSKDRPGRSTATSKTWHPLKP